MSNIEQLIEWIVTEIDMLTYEQLNKSNTSAKIKWLQIGLNQCLTKIKQLQKEEPKTYTQEEMDKAISKAWKQGHEEGYDLAYDKYKFNPK